jgi:RimJ/RimL family protein N-acetyltransferase
MVTLREATEADAELLRTWRNDPDVRSVSRSTTAVAADEHAEWLAAVLADPERFLLVVEANGEAVGQLRFDRRDHALYEISVSIAAERRGAGLGPVAIEAGLGWLCSRRPGSAVEAVVRPGNESSRRAFEAAGFRAAGGKGGFERFRRRCSTARRS